jgi:hypothetical protein
MGAGIIEGVETNLRPSMLFATMLPNSKRVIDDSPRTSRSAKSSGTTASNTARSGLPRKGKKVELQTLFDRFQKDKHTH